MSETEKEKKKRDSIKNLQNTNRILSRKLADTKKYLSQEIKNVEAQRDRYKLKVKELTEELKLEKAKNSNGDSSKTDSAFTKTIVCGTAGIKRRSAFR
ncbi:hypothetical protein [Microcoleus sp. B4-C1]|uniref:hypothetical protein n=1 Tax=Microcoleus sp. B4-C1 TaxID=2818660 RepID=UPI002FD14181